ncbi:MAG: zinc-ribbon and DUF3426 domain-containing protein [Betaproteobacteria bacterium]
MADEKFTRCPGCKTIFRVTAQQLAMRAGQVRCGHCRTVFDGVAALVSLAPQPAHEPELDEIAMGPPTVTLRSSQALQPAPFDDDHDSETHDEREELAAERAEAYADPHVAYSSRFSWQEKKERHRVPTWLVGLAIPVLLVLLAAQALFHFRDAIAAHWPTTKPTLIRLCSFASCEVQPLTDIAALSIEASDLQADPAHRGLLILSTTIRNRAPYAQLFPYVELTLSDTQDQVVVRRAFAPAEYLSAAADPRAGIAGNSELAVKLFIDASATTQAGYQVYLFYP